MYEALSYWSTCAAVASALCGRSLKKRRIHQVAFGGAAHQFLGVVYDAVRAPEDLKPITSTAPGVCLCGWVGGWVWVGVGVCGCVGVWVWVWVCMRYRCGYCLFKRNFFISPATGTHTCR